MRKRVVVLAGLLVLVIIGGGLYTAVARLDTKGDKVIRQRVRTWMGIKFTLPTEYPDEPKNQVCLLQ